MFKASPSMASGSDESPSRDNSLHNESSAELLRDNPSVGDYSKTDVDIVEQKTRCSQTIENVKVYTAFLCLLACINGAISAGYLPSVITTVEKRYELDSSTTGLIVAFYEIGASLTVIFISYFGDQKHIPRILAVGTILVGTGSLIFVIPHATYGSIDILLARNSSDTSDVCMAHLENEKADQCVIETNGTTKGERSGTIQHLPTFLIAQTLIGMGSTPILTLGLSFIDKHVRKEKAALYIAFAYASAAMGPVLGFGSGAGIMELYIDFLVMRPTFNSADSRWLGAWWLGFVIFGLASFIVAIPFFFIPKSLPVKPSLKRGGDEIRAGGDDKQHQSLKEMGKSFLILLKNPIYMAANLGTVFEMVIVTGFITFVPKYLELQFDMKTSQANLLTGVLAIPGAVAGIIIMGRIMARLNLELLGASCLTLILNVIALGGFMVVFPLGCDNTMIAGVTAPYSESLGITSNWTVNITSECNEPCGCDANTYRPVCAIQSGITFFSSCHAGCASTLGQNCSCTQNSVPGMLSAVPSNISDVELGVCRRECQNLTPFMIVLFTLSFLLAGMKTPLTMVTMQSVQKNLRSFSLGIQTVFVRALALLPAPIIFGKIIDTTCNLWKHECGSRKNCLIYDTQLFRYKYAGICIGLHVLGLISFVAMLLFVLRQRKRDLGLVLKKTKASADGSDTPTTQDTELEDLKLDLP